MTQIVHKIRKKKLKLKGFAEEDYYFDAIGTIVFTEKYHQKRGYCCKKCCKHCPWATKHLSAPKI